MVCSVGFSHFFRIPDFQCSLTYLTAMSTLFEESAGTLVLPFGEMIFSLEDVSWLLGLPVAGRPVTWRKPTNLSAAHALFGEIPAEGIRGPTRVKLAWLQKMFGVKYSPDDDEQRWRQGYAFLWYLLGGVLYGNSDTSADVGWLEVIEGIEQKPLYSWGSAFLVHPQAMLASARQFRVVSGFAPFFQVCK